MKRILFFFIIFFFAISNCGYEPIYSKNQNTNVEISKIYVKNIKDRSGQILRNSLLNKINPERERVIYKYRLIVEMSESKSSLAYRKDMSATRTDLEITANYFLSDIKNENILIKEEIKSTTSFDVVESVYATLIAEKDAREKSLQVISEDIFTNLVIFFKN